jgi:hypothetical protein
MSHEKGAKFLICFLVCGVCVANDPWTRWVAGSQVQSIWMHECLFNYQKKKRKKKKGSCFMSLLIGLL